METKLSSEGQQRPKTIPGQELCCFSLLLLLFKFNFAKNALALCDLKKKENFFSSQTPNKTAGAWKEKVWMTCLHQLETQHVMERKTTPEISCHYQAGGDANLSATAWKNQVWDSINFGVSVV